MAESVDALVSNTSGATHPGSIPGLGTKRKSRNAFPLLLYIYFDYTFIIYRHSRVHLQKFFWGGVSKVLIFSRW